MWNYRYRLVAIPESVASHVRGLTFGRGKSTSSAYLGERNRIALSIITNTKYKYIILSHMLRSIIVSASGIKAKGLTQARVRALYDGVRLGRRLKSKGLFIDIYKAPLIKVPLMNVRIYFIARHVIIRYFEDWVVKNLSSLTLE